MTAWRTHLSCVVVDAESGIFKILMRQEDLCGRTGHFQFVIVLSGNLANGEKVIERIGNATDIEFTSELVQWVEEETSLQLLYRLDLASELTS
jgi:GGDEF domain-containing protein